MKKGRLALPELRYDILSGDTVVIAGERAKRPSDFKSAQMEMGPTPERDPRCPFCEGNEEMTPPEVYAVRKDGRTNGPGWTVRVVPNKFPAFVPKETLNAEELEKCEPLEEQPPQADDASMYWESFSVGAHEVVIESPRHNRTLGSMSEDEILLVLKSIRMRAQVLNDVDYIKYVHIFRNWGPRGGASLLHPHFQIMGLPFIPKNISLEVQRLAHYRDVTGRCLICDYLERELEKNIRVIKVTSEYVVLCPFASKYSYEVLVLPRKHGLSCLESGENGEKGLAQIISWLFGKYEDMFSSLSYNLVFHINPKGASQHYHWHIHVYPRLNVEAGLELGTGVYINPTSPEAAAKEFLRQEEKTLA